jgi:long-chain acyl-CoA synthetase
MTVPHQEGAVPARTLPDWLLEQARRRPHAVALRDKRLGEWRTWTWHAVAVQVEQLAAGLAERGFVAGDLLILLGEPRDEALLLSLAAQWAGGVALPLDPGFAGSDLQNVLRQRAPRFAFAADDAQVDRLLTYSQRVIDANPRGLPAHPDTNVIDYGAFGIAREGGFAPLAKPYDDAFAFVRVENGQGAEGPSVLVEQRLTHATLVQEAQHLVEVEKLHADDEALAARAFAAAAQARYLIAPWLLTGFRLNFPESLATRDNDRRELAPTLVAGTRETYARVARLVDDRLPGAESLRRKLLRRAQQAHGGPLTRALTWWLITRPLREVIGFERTHAALVAGPPLDDETAALFRALRVDVQAWPDAGDWRRLPDEAPLLRATPYRHDGQLGQPA